MTIVCTGTGVTVGSQILGRSNSVTKPDNPNPTPQEWRAATDYALMLGDKMLRASEERVEEKKCEPPSKPTAK